MNCWGNAPTAAVAIFARSTNAPIMNQLIWIRTPAIRYLGSTFFSSNASLVKNDLNMPNKNRNQSMKFAIFFM